MAEVAAAFLLTTFIGAGAATGVALSVTTALIGIGISLGLGTLAQQFLGQREPQITPLDRQFVQYNSVAPRNRTYGRARLAGVQVFIGAAAGNLYRVLAHNVGPIDAVEAHFIDEVQVTLDNQGWVEQARFQFNGSSRCRVQFHDGSGTPAVYNALASAFPAWDSDHRGFGVVHSMTTFRQIPQEDFAAMWPAFQNTQYRMQIRGALVWDPRDEAQDPNDPDTWTWSPNAALVILDYLRHETGYAMPLAWLEPEIDSWIAAADACGEDVAGIARYHIYGTYNYNQRPADVLQQLLAACNGRLWIGANGGLALSVGKWAAPTVTIDDDAIVSCRVASGNEGPDSVNMIRATFTSRAQGYVEVDSKPYVDAANVAAFGVRSADLRLVWVPERGQARRLQKQALAQVLPEWRGQIRCNLRALPALSERFVHIVISELDLEVDAEIVNVEFDIAEGSIVTGLIIEWVSVTADAFDYAAEDDEETPPDTPGDTLPPPANFNVTVESRASGASTVAVAVVSWDAYDVDGLRVHVEYKRSTDTDWLTTPDSATGAVQLEIAALIDGATYQFRGRTVGLSGSSAFSSTVTRTITVDSVAPAVPTALSATPSGSDVTVAWTNPNSANCYGGRVYRNTTNNAASATLIATRYGGPSLALSYTDEALAAGTYWYFVAAINGSGVASARTAAGSVTI